MTRRKASRALRRLFPLIPRGEMAQEMVLNGLERELNDEPFPGDLRTSPVLRRFETEARQLGNDPMFDALDEPPGGDPFDDFDEPRGEW